MLAHWLTGSLAGPRQVQFTVEAQAQPLPSSFAIIASFVGHCMVTIDVGGEGKGREGRGGKGSSWVRVSL